MKGICKLCQKDKELIKRSHLFPNFMYKGIADGKNRINIVSSERPLERKWAQTGAMDEFILCADCDNGILGKLERYANNSLYSKSYLNDSEDFEQLTPNPGVNIVACKRLDYSKFKLFLESLLWRASITSHPMFSNFKFSCDQEEELRVSILNQQPLGEASFPCVMMTCADAGVKTDIVAIDPSKKEMVKFYINGFTYTFYWGIGNTTIETVSMALRNNNTMVIVKLAKDDWNNIRKSLVGALRDASFPNLPKR